MKKETCKGIDKGKVEWFPTINYDKCTGCLACVDFCTHGVYTTKDGKPKVIAPEKCVVGCTKCDDVCPNGAITHPSKSKLNKPAKQVKSSSGCSCGGKCK